MSESDILSELNEVQTQAVVSETDILAGLNPVQTQAVVYGEGPLLVLAGAGSGKTKVITHRIAHLINSRGIKPWEILALTFTNKAAAEMRHRIEALLGFDSLRMWMGTFHSMCARILRRHAAVLGYSSRFLIFDEIDQKSVLRRILKEMGIDKEVLKPEQALYQINTDKQELIDPSFYKNIDDPDQQLLGRVYRAYQDSLVRADGMDFGDLLFNVIRLFSDHSDILESYQQRFKYILVDEFQDTDSAQHALVDLLSGESKNVCAVGDDNQSIYMFRGAEVENVLDFERSFPGAKVLHMMQNYRSTMHILGAANDVIGYNRGRRHLKGLFSDLGEGKEVVYYNALNGWREAEFVMNVIVNKVKMEGRSYRDCAVFYRTHSQSRVFEEKFLGRDIPHQVVGGIAFYSRREVKDVMAYLRLVANPLDDVSLRRVINVPARSLGTASVNKLTKAAADQDKHMWEILEDATDNEAFTLSLARKFLRFKALITDLRVSAKGKQSSEIIRMIIEKTEYLKYLGKMNPIEAVSRQENVEELVTIAVEYEAANPEGTLDGFLEKVALVTDIDKWADRDDKVTLMTLHAAKGLEFPVVFITGLEETILPHANSLGDRSELEEERRLFYVGVTRAQRELFITSALERARFGKVTQQEASRFIDEISSAHIRRVFSALTC